MSLSCERENESWLDLDNANLAQSESLNTARARWKSHLIIWYCLYQPPLMRFRPSSYVWLFRLSSFTGELYLSANPVCRFRPALHTSPPLLSARKFTMQSNRNVTSEEDLGRADEPGFFKNIPAVATEDTDPPAEKKRVGSTLVVNERKLRTPSPLFGANCDDDSEAESFRDGRTEEVDRDTRGRAFAWCRDFLSGSWKIIKEDDFQISIVR